MHLTSDLCLFQWNFLTVVFASTAKELIPSSMSDFHPAPNTRTWPRRLWTWVFPALMSFCWCSFVGAALAANLVLQSQPGCLVRSWLGLLSVVCSRNLPTPPCGRCACVTKTSAPPSLKPGPGNTERPSWSRPIERMLSTECMRRLRRTSWQVEDFDLTVAAFPWTP